MERIKSKTELKRLARQLGHVCNDCGEKLGGKVPEPGIITVAWGKCPMCKKESAQVPFCDFDFAALKVKAVFD